MLKAYLRQKRLTLIGTILCCGIFVTAFYLYHLPIVAVGYPALVCTVLGVGFIAYDYRKKLEKHRRLEDMQRLSAELMTYFPDPDRIEDEDYRRIIEVLCRQHSDFVIHSENKFNNMVEYYTVWAHQIKTPIASMRLKLKNDDSALSRELTIDLGRIEQYVEMVLTFLRLDSDTTDYLFRSCDLDDIICQSVKRFSGEFIVKKIALNYTRTDFDLVTDEKWLCFVIEQVLSNALKYTSSGSISIKMETPGILKISDTGIGIEADDLPRIFEKGYTGFNGREDKRASGLGLYLCKRICDNIGIRISAESQVDVGTTVILDMTQKKFSGE